MTTAAYRDRITGAYPISLDTIRAGANVLFGDEPPRTVLDAAEVDAVEAVERPAFDPATETLAERPPSLEGVSWRQTWAVTPIPPPPVPATVGPLQFRRAVRLAGQKPAFDAFVAALDEEGREAVEYATEFRRADPLVETARQGLGWTPAQVDDLFRLAASL